MTLAIVSPAFAKGAMIHCKCTCDTGDTSPELKWSGTPKGTKRLSAMKGHIPAEGQLMANYHRYRKVRAGRVAGPGSKSS